MKKLLLGLGLCAAVGAACVIDVNDFSGKTCETASDCPEPYVCVAARAGAGRTCEVLGRPALSDGGDPSAGPVPTYCQDIEPILARNCVSSCHGADHTNGQPGFRLDYYAPPDGGGEPGALAKADRIKARASDFQTMPPPGNPAPSQEERRLIARWVVGGAPLCGDGDGGTPDGGGQDGGSPDAGP